MSSNLEALEGTDIKVDLDLLVQAFADGIKGNPEMDEPEARKVIQEFSAKVSKAMQAKQAKEAEGNKATGAAYLQENKQKEGVTVTESGLQYKVLAEGSGSSPAATDRVKVHYSGTLIDGTKFDSSYDRGEPATFGVTQVIKGWTEALQLMTTGSKWQLVIPSELAYGESGRPSIPGSSVLLFDVELIEIVAAKVE